MNTLFREPIGTDFDIKNTNFGEFYPSINPAMSWKQIRPYVINATRQYIIPYIGRPFYNVISAIVESSVTDDDINDEIIYLMRSSIAQYAIYLAMPHHNVVISDMGVQQSSSDNSRNAAQWAYNNARWAALYGAERTLDELLDFMYTNKSDPKLGTWNGNYVFTAHFTDFIAGNKELSQFCNIKTLRGYKSMLPYLKKQEGELNKILGSRTYADIKSKLSTTHVNEVELIRLIRYYIVSSSLLAAIPNLTLYLEDGNIISLSTSDIVTIGVNSEGNRTAISRVLEQSKNDAKYYENEIRNYLTIYRDYFTMWNEDCYQESRSKSVFYSPTNIDGNIVGGIMI